MYRFYVGDLRESIRNIYINHIYFSDHAAVIMRLSLDNIGKRGKYYWKLNTSLLESDDVNENFLNFWHDVKRRIYSFSNICDWWEKYAKPDIKNFFIKQGKIINQLKLGKINYLENKLKIICFSYR